MKERVECSKTKTSYFISEWEDRHVNEFTQRNPLLLLGPKASIQINYNSLVTFNTFRLLKCTRNVLKDTDSKMERRKMVSSS